ncbi:MAG: hypothetical protein H6964_01660 [Chromatiaceae bacterium]|nr:hypothetical protein [Chromatiaceae bacterium]
MIRSLSIMAALVLGAWNQVHADANEWRTTLEPAAITAYEMQAIGNAVCGDGGFEETENGLSCTICPEFTGNAGSNSGLEIGHPFRGRFSGAKAGQEWIVDTEGCEAHFAGFGGALLLEQTISRPLPGSPAAVLSSKPATAPTNSPLSLIYYKPGFRLNDCLIFGGKDERSLLVCNEADMAQGEVIGHISAMEISRRDITRWRLLRWYDNSASDMARMISVVPTDMRQVQLKDGEQSLQITLAIAENSADSKVKSPKTTEKNVTLVYLRKSQRLFATPETQQLLGEINLLTGQMLD